MRYRRAWMLVLSLAVAGLLTACDENTPLMKAVLDSDQQKIASLLDGGADVNQRNEYGWTALSHAARAGDAAMAKLLLDRGADINAADSAGWTPLIRAAMKGHAEVVKVLLDRGANVNVQESTGWTALHWAAARGHKEAVELLLTHGADLNLKTRDGYTPGMLALKENEPDIGQLITLAERKAKQTDGAPPGAGAAGTQ